MKRTAIYTIRSKNFGNRLQNYALQTTVEKLNYSCVTLQDTSDNTKIDDFLNFHPQLGRFRLLILFYIRHKNRIKKLFHRNDNFDCFDDSNIHEAREFISPDEVSLNIKNKYDVLIAGSDQIWNTSFNFVSINSFLPFPHPKKIAFAASFGIDKIPYNETVANALNDFKAISVREDAGARIVKNLTGREATVLVDPTMLLTQTEWRNVAKKPKGAKEGYLLTCFLSPICDDAKKLLDEIKIGREVHELINTDDEIVGNAGPAEFLWLIDHADLVLTDSFHACVFSFLFNRPFIVYDRNWNEVNMNSRLETFLPKFSLERKYACSGIENDIWEHNYEEGYKQLEVERKKAMDFLREALKD